MKYFGEGLSEKHKELNSIIRKSAYIDQAKELFLDLHSYLHASSISSSQRNEYDELLDGLKDNEYFIMPTSKDETIAWALWHIARIEDITMNILVNEKDQVFNQYWKQLMNSNITDTGNALSDEEIIDFSNKLNISTLLEYRAAVGQRTRDIIKSLSNNDIKRKISQHSLNKIFEEGGVTAHKDSIWLLDFWGKKDVAGILLMPPTRHVMLHLNDCCKWKVFIQTRNKFYL